MARGHRFRAGDWVSQEGFSGTYNLGFGDAEYVKCRISWRQRDLG